MILAGIVAMDEQGLMGRDNSLPWHLPADLKHFKNLTLGKSILMGRKTFESIGKALPGRKNIIITRHREFTAPDCVAVYSIDEALSQCKEEEEVMIIGGAELFKQTLPMIQKLYLTVIHHLFEGDIYFPKFNRNDWKEIEKSDHLPDEKNKYPYTFLTLVRKKN